MFEQSELKRNCILFVYLHNNESELNLVCHVTNVLYKYNCRNFPATFGTRSLLALILILIEAFPQGNFAKTVVFTPVIGNAVL